MPDESIEVVDSDNGGLGLPHEAPSEQPTVTDAPAEVVEPTKPVVPSEPELFELPDGRKVDGDTLAKEWKENFLPDYTRKSQKLSEIEKGNITNKEPIVNPYADPEYVPQSYEEIIQAAKQAALDELANRETERVERERALESEVLTQLEGVKKLDPNVNENALFLHATKYNFRDLSVAYQNMKDMNALVKNVQKTTAQNIAKRNDPVSSLPGAIGQRPDPSNFSNATEYLRSLK